MALYKYTSNITRALYAYKATENIYWHDIVESMSNIIVKEWSQVGGCYLQWLNFEVSLTAG